jgi:hypothetical protein
MNISSDTLSLLTVLLVILVVIGVFVRIAIRVRRGGGSLTTISLGATDEFLTKDRRKAAEMIVNQNAGKKLEEQSSEEPDDPKT